VVPTEVGEVAALVSFEVARNIKTLTSQAECR
jgi:hypothetical protein